MKQLLEKLLTAADNHGEDSGEPDHTVGDLQDLLRATWGLMSAGQKALLMEDSTVADLVDVGARDEFTAEDLQKEARQSIADMEAAARAAGYVFMENELGFYWEIGEFEGTPRVLRDDAIESAFQDMSQPH